MHIINWYNDIRNLNFSYHWWKLQILTNRMFSIEAELVELTTSLNPIRHNNNYCYDFLLNRISLIQIIWSIIWSNTHFAALTSNGSITVTSCNERYGVSSRERLDCLLKRFFRRRSKKTSTIKAPRHCPLWGESTVRGPLQKVGNAENISIWWRHVITHPC